MNADDLRAFAHRDWAAVERSRRTYWAERFAHDGAAPARQAATALFNHARCIGVVGADDSGRADDLASHLQMRDRLDRAARALIGR